MKATAAALKRSWSRKTTTGAYAHTSTENLVQSGKSYGSIVGYVADGIFQNQEEAFPQVHATTSLDDILADEEIRGVFVSVSPKAHFSIASALRCLSMAAAERDRLGQESVRHGEVYILTEKPLLDASLKETHQRTIEQSLPP